jgi:phosphoenolpyruvate phosphomutase
MPDTTGMLGPRALWIGVGNPASARLVERARPGALWVSSYCASAELRGVADMSLVSPSEMIDLARRIGLAVAMTPVVLDCDSGFGDEHIWRQAVEEIVRTTDVAAVCIEDKLFPKRNSFYETGQVLADVASFQRMIAVAVGVRDAHRPAMRIVARTETLIAGGSPHEAAERLAAYAEAGADGFFVQARSSAEELAAVLAMVTGSSRLPVVVAPSAFSDRPPSHWWAAGASVVIHANQLLRLALQAQARAMATLLTPDAAPAELDDAMWSMREVDALVERPEPPGRPRSAANPQVSSAPSRPTGR